MLRHFKEDSPQSLSGTAMHVQSPPWIWLPRWTSYSGDTGFRNLLTWEQYRSLADHFARQAALVH